MAKSEAVQKSAWMPINCSASLSTTDSPFICTNLSMDLIWMQSPRHYLAKQAARGLRLRDFNWSCLWMAALDLKGLVLAVSSLLTACVPGIWPCHFEPLFFLLCLMSSLLVTMTVPLPLFVFFMVNSNRIDQQIHELVQRIKTVVLNCLLILIPIDRQLCVMSFTMLVSLCLLLWWERIRGGHMM